MTTAPTGGRTTAPAHHDRPTTTTTTGDTMTTLTLTPATTDAVRFTTAPATPFTPTPVVLTAGTVVAIRWAGYNGVRGATALHKTETVVSVATTDGVRGVLTLTGGAYKNGATTRTLNTHRADGRPSSQILGAYPVGAVVAALAAVMGATPATTDADDHADADGATTDDHDHDGDGVPVVGGRSVAARRGYARAKRAARRTLRRVERRDAIRAAWHDHADA